MSPRCEECGAATQWEADLGSAVCVQCGTLVDPSQNVLSSHLEDTNASARELPYLDGVQGKTIKGRRGWALGGVDKAARLRRNTIATHEFIRSILNRLSNPGLASRAQGIFDQAMSRGRYRWGRQAELVAGASIAIALRESQRNDSVHDIAYLLNVTPVAINGMFTAITSLLQLPLVLADPASHIPSLQTHLMTFIQGSSASQPALPANLQDALATLAPHMHEIGRTATALADLVVRTNILAHLPTQPTACALLLLALEAERCDSLPHAGVLAEALGRRIGKSKRVVMERYKVIYELIENWIGEVPWLDGHQKTVGGRSKVAKRVVVARGLKDVLQFREEIWKKKMDTMERPILELELDSQDGSTEDGMSEAGTSSRGSEDNEIIGPTRKKRKTVHERTIAGASQFLLHPASPTIPSRRSQVGPSSSDLLTHLLTADDASLPHVFTNAPSRLQLLAAERGGARENDILDDELFADGELEGMIRTDEEVAALKTVMNWDNDKDQDEQSAEGGTPPSSKRKAPQRDAIQGANVQHSTRRIDFAALAKILGPSDDPSREDYGEDVTPYTFAFGDEGEVVEAWRPVSPGGKAIDEDWYED